jgi:hypothetical protein
VISSRVSVSCHKGSRYEENTRNRGAGFLGSHLCERLVAKGHDVLCVDNFFTGTKLNTSHLMKHPHFELLRHDVTFPLYVEVDEIYNLACPASPIHYQFDPVQTTKTSVHGAINVLGLAKRVKARILQASTSEVYGDPEVHPQSEGYWGHVNPVGVRSCYDEGKRCAETLFFDYWRQHRLRIKVVRIFNTYGPRMALNDGRVVSNFVMQALNGGAASLNPKLRVTSRTMTARPCSWYKFWYASADRWISNPRLNIKLGATSPVDAGPMREPRVVLLSELPSDPQRALFPELCRTKTGPFGAWRRLNLSQTK